MLEALRASETPSVGKLAALSLASIAVLGGLGWLVLLDEDGRKARLAQSMAAAGFVLYAVVLLSS
jgi:hypothetical protein